MTYAIRYGLVLLGMTLVVSCSGDPYEDPSWDGGPRDGGRPDASHMDSGPSLDVALLPDREVNPDGPTIIITAPEAGAVLSSDQVQLVALISDPDGVRSSSAKAVIPGGEEFPLQRSGTMSDQFSGIVDLRSIPSGDFGILVEAADLEGTYNSTVVTLVRDTGPEVEFINPASEERFAGSAPLNVVVSDPRGVDEASVEARVGQVALVLTKQAQDTTDPNRPTWIRFTSEIIFDAPVFQPPLSGEQQITVKATNIDHGVQGSANITFVVDHQGPSIVVEAPTPGEILGGIIEIRAAIDDPAGVLSSSVVAVLAHSSTQYTVPLVSVGGGPYRGSFDSRQFPSSWIFPSLSIRAADLLSNESEMGFLVALDNTSPAISLDPPTDFHLCKKNSFGYIECSRPFDPVGPGVPNDGEQVPQVFFLRARIEDRGNSAVGLTQMPIALVDKTTPRLYVLDDTSDALLVDLDGDGYCDEVNPLLQPASTPSTSDEVLALYLDPIPPAGSADYRFLLEPFPTLDATWGSADSEPSPLCINVENDGGFGRGSFNTAIFYTADLSEPAIYSLPPVISSHPSFCAGHQFDALANGISEGWVCVAVRTVDAVGNVGISAPLRLFVDYTLDGSPSYNPATAPHCTGTWNAITQTVDPSIPCQFHPATQMFPLLELRREDL